MGQSIFDITKAFFLRLFSFFICFFFIMGNFISDYEQNSFPAPGFTVVCDSVCLLTRILCTDTSWIVNYKKPRIMNKYVLGLNRAASLTE